MPFFVYLVQCADDTLYCGYAHDLKKRIQVHNEGKASKYTRSRLPVRLVFSEKHSTKSRAMKREYAIKQMTREQKKKLIRK